MATTSSPDALPFPIAQDEPHSPSPRRSSRIKRPPPITPRRFKRFFAPRVKFAEDVAEDARSPLKDVPESDINVRNHDASERPAKRRRVSFTSSPISSSLPSSPVKHVGFLTGSQENDFDSDSDPEVDDEMGSDGDDEEVSDGGDFAWEEVVPRPKTYRHTSLSTRLLATRIDSRPHTRTPRLGHDFWQHETANFYSSPFDLNLDKGVVQPYSRPRRGPALPFCTTSCNTNSLVAVCDEDGYVRLMDAGNEHADQFHKTYLTLKPHDNAIMDAEFSSDDKYLVTASGDQTCSITDVQQQKSIWSLSKHACSVKKVQFQPGNTNVLVSCARDGDINIWDVRQNPCDLPARVAQNSITDDMDARSPLHSIWEAHHPGKTKSKVASTSSEYCVTSMTFLDETRPHLFATSSDKDTIVRLWDIRSKHSFRNKTVPISQTAEPESHETHRRFGVTSMALSGDGSKFYTLCRDHTIYAYSTSHLILGSGSEMAPDAPRWKGEKHGHKYGLGPLYGFRDPAMAVTTFYLKMAVRKATDQHPELLAVGSSDNCAVIYPTDERYHVKTARAVPYVPKDRATNPTGRLKLTRTDYQSTSLSLKKRPAEDTIPIYYLGTPLVRGHSSEVTGVAWSNEGNLVTVGDDLGTRCWRENAEKARFYRNGYEGEVERAGAGWAVVRDEDWDEDV